MAKTNPITKYVAALLISLPFSAYCKDVDIKATVNNTAYVYETEIGDNEATQNKAIIIRPSLIGSYSSRGISASLTANHSRVNKSGDSGSSKQNYTNLAYNSSFYLIENALSLTLSGAQSYRSISQQQQYFSDIILASDGLTKTQNNRAQLDFTNPNPRYVGLSLQSTYSKTKTDQSQESNSGIDSDNVGVVARLYQGKNIRFINFNISAQYNDTSRSNLQNFQSTRVQGNLGFPFTSTFEFLITGSLDEYDTGQASFTGRSNLDTSSYGAGLRWNSGKKSNLSLTYNQLDEGEKQTEFIGLNLNWAFTSRTVVNFDYSQRFYGDAYSLNFKHSLKSLRTSVSYSEDVTSYSRFGASNTIITGIFVCEFGSTELTDCFQPDSLDYQLQAGEEFRATTEIDTDITEEVLFRKSGNASIGYDKRKIKISLDAKYQRIEYLESNRLNINRSLRLNFNYALGRKTNISFASTISKNQLSESEDPDTIVTTSITFKRDLGRYLKLNLSARLLDRESDSAERDVTDKRLTLGLNYTF